LLKLAKVLSDVTLLGKMFQSEMDANKKQSLSQQRFARLAFNLEAADARVCRSCDADKSLNEFELSIMLLCSILKTVVTFDIKR
jgi:hypothetical protein